MYMWLYMGTLRPGETSYTCNLTIYQFLNITLLLYCHLVAMQKIATQYLNNVL